MAHRSGPMWRTDKEAELTPLFGGFLKKRRSWFGSGAVAGSSGRCWRMQLSVTVRSACLYVRQHKSAGHRRPGPARVLVQGCNMQGLTGKNQNPGGGQMIFFFWTLPLHSVNASA